MSEIKPRNGASSYQVEIKLRPDYTDAEGQGALGLLHSLGVNTAREVRASRLYELRGALTSAQVQQAARELLCDPVTQEFRMFNGHTPVLNGMNHWRIEVWLKPSVTDPVGDTVRAALEEMGLAAAESVRVGTAYHVTGKCGRNQLEKAVARSLANPVIHRFTVTEAPL
ncbi:MAG: phosphoribosylformylglycinamidine synthase subunit PurS [Elusimicrobia bacterium]|nr:phosphoribosylformylglycinamidine synthase subunit PurS [Elusimicrobiota bacterium]